jgi:hypothetical protein
VKRVYAIMIPQVVLFGGMAVMLAAHPHAITAGVQSTRAMVVNAVLLTGWLVLSWVLWHWPRVYVAVLSVVALAAIAVLVVPTLRDSKVVEAFPTASAGDRVTPGSSRPESPAPTTTLPAAPVRISSGTLEGVGHDASGDASVYERADGSRVVALEGIDIEPGPDYRVIVVRGADEESPGDGLELDALRGNQGTQYYEVPSATDVGDGWTVLIWCRAFGVPVANASQRAT